MPPPQPQPNSASGRLRARVGLAAWTAAILAVTVPTDFVGHTHWQKVQWIPFVSPPVKLLDVLANVALYGPFGFGLLRAFRPRVRPWHTVAIAGSLSLAIEYSQLYSHSRFPSLQDVVCNVLGAGLGAWWADALQ